MAFKLRIPFFARRRSLLPTRFLVHRTALYAAVERERLRTDRNGSPFCLVIFDAENYANPPGENEERDLAKFLCSRLRDTDAVGRWQGRVAALLVDTTPAGARRVVDEAIEASAAGDRRYRATIRTYPGGLDDSDDADDVGDRQAIEEEGETDVVPAGVRRSDIAAAGASGDRYYFLRELTPPVPFWKRAFDVIAAGSGLLAVSPLLAIAAVAVKLDSPGPILFAQRRTGRRGVPFVMYKFRTMTVDAESKKAALRALSVQDGPAFKLEHDPRITRVGAILRKSCVDELPQLWNVLRGEMSIVGPRPLPVDEADKCADWQQRRHAVLPGLTCYWQSLGTARVPFLEWMRLDLRYIRTISPWVDLSLIVRTLTHVVLARASR